MKKHYYMRTTWDAIQGRNITRVYECDVIITDTGGHFPNMKTSKEIGIFSHEWRAEKFIKEMEKSNNDR